MCVITFVEGERPTDYMVEKMWDQNKDGAGIAWFEPSRDGKGEEVVWKKGIEDVEEIKRLCREMPVPYVAHFRIASVGGVKRSLTHPFLINERAIQAIEGRTKGRVLFHNGHWHLWNEKALEAAIHSNNKIPDGDWSDTRAMAWLCHLYGAKVLDMLPSQKAIVMRPRTQQFPHGIEIYTGDGWKKVEVGGGHMWCSNDYWWSSNRHNKPFHMGGNMGGSGSVAQRYLCERGQCRNRVVQGTNLCEECTKGTGTKDDKEDHSASNTPKPVTALVLLTGGTPRPLANAFTEAEVDAFKREQKVSKSKYKKMKREFSKLGKGGRREFRAIAELGRLSSELAEQLLQDQRKSSSGHAA